MNNKQYSDLLLNYTKDLIWMVDHQLHLVYANKSYLNLMKEITGLEKELNTPILVEGFGEGYIEKWRAYYHRALSDETFIIEEHFFHPVDNQIHYGHISFSPIKDEEGNVNCVACRNTDVTDIVREKYLASSLIDASLDVFCTIDEVGNFIYVSEAATKHWGYTPNELVGVPYVSLIIEEDISKTNDIADAIFSGEEIKSFVNRYKRKDGGIAYNQWSARWDYEAKLMYCVARDAKEKIKQENLLLQSEKRFRALIENGADAIVILGVDGKPNYVSSTIYKLLGYTEEEALELNLFEIIHPDDREGVASRMTEVLQLPGVPIQGHTSRTRHKDGSWRWLEAVIVNMLHDPDINGIVDNFRDVTERKEEEHRLRLLESVVTNTNDAILITEAEPFDEPGPRIIFVNEAFTRMTGYTAEEVIGKTPRILQGPNSDKAELARLSKALRNWEPCEITTINYKKNGEEFWINFSISPVADETGWFTHWIAIERDVTEKKKLELSTNLTAKISALFNREPDLSSALNKLCEEVAVISQFSFCEIWLTDIQESLLELKAVHKYDDAATIFYENSKLNTVFEKGQGVQGKIWENAQPIIWEYKGKNQDLLFRSVAAEKAGIKTIVGFPLMYHNRFIGVLQFGTQAIAKNIEWIINTLNELGAFIGAEIARKKIEIELAQIFEFAPDIIITAGFDGYIKRINPAGLALLGYSLEEMKSRPIISFIHEQDRLLTQDKQLELYSGEDLRNFENRYITKEGKIVWLSWTSTSLPDQGIVYAVAKNITEEKSLRELNRLVGELAKIGSWEVDVVNQTVFWSDEVHQIYGTDPSSFVPSVEGAIKFYRDDFRELALSSFENCIVTQEPYTIEAVIVNSSMKEVWVRTTANAEFMNGECTRVYGSFQDIHERKEAEIRLQSLADNLPGVVFQYIKYPDGTDGLIHVSNGAELIWGFSANDAMQNNQQIWKQIEKGGDLEAHKKSIEISIETKSLWKNKYRYLMPNNEIKTHLGYGTPTFLADGKIIFNSVILDITEEAKNEELLKQTSNIARIGSWEVDLINNSIIWSDITNEIHETPKNFKPQLSEAIHFYREDFRELVTEAVNGCIETGDPFDFEAIIVTNKNNEVWVRSIGRAEMLDGKCARIFGSFQDIHERKIIEDQKNSLLTTLEKSLNELYVFDAETLKFSYVNQGALNNIGYSEQEIKALTPIDIKPEFTATTFNKLVNPLVNKEKEKIIFFTNHKRKNGSLYPVEVHLQFVVEGNNKRFLAVILDITERKKTEADRMMAEKNYQELFDKSNDAIYVHDIDTGQLMDVNYRATELTGFDKVDILENAPSILFTENPEYTIEKAFENIQKAAQGKPQVFEWLTKKKDGTSGWFEMTLKRTNIAGVDKILAFQRDIAERKLFEEKLTQSEQKYRLLALQLQLQKLHLTNAQEVAKVGSWETDLTNLKLTWSDETYRIFGTDRESFEPTHGSFLNYVHPEDREKVDKALLDSTQATAQTQHWIEHRIVTASGEVKVLEERWRVTFGDKGEPLLAVGSCQDITERKRTEKKLKMANERFEKATEATNDVIWDWDIESGTLFRSNAIDNFFGVEASKVLKKKNFWNDNFHKEDILKIKSSIQKSLEDPDCNRWEEEYRILHNNNDIIFVIDRGLILRNKNGKAIRMVGAMTNITEQKKQEEKLIELNQSLNHQAIELKRSNEELEQFAFIASHDLQEPLRMISSFMDQLKRKYADQLDEKGLQYIHFATDGAKRMKQIILDLLLYSRANKSIEQNELINLNEIVSEYTQLRRKVIAERKATITFDGLPTIETYRAPITQIFHCLLDNALKYVDENKSPSIEIGAIEKENVWQFAIKDNGIGIDQKFFDKIFIIFQRLQNRKEDDGTGIGLAIAKRSIEFLGGEIWVESEIDKGSTFYFTILKIKQLI